MISTFIKIGLVYVNLSDLSMLKPSLTDTNSVFIWMKSDPKDMLKQEFGSTEERDEFIKKFELIFTTEL